MTKTHPMYLTKALKKKVKLISQIKVMEERFTRNNSRLDSKTPVYDPESHHEEWVKLKKELVELKSAIIITTAPVYHKIFQMAEHKASIATLKRLDVSEGAQDNIYGSASDPVKTKVAFLNEVARDRQVEELEEEIEKLQEELERYNSTTKLCLTKSK